MTWHTDPVTGHEQLLMPGQSVPEPLVTTHAPGPCPFDARCGVTGAHVIVASRPGQVDCPTCRALQNADDQAEDDALEARSRWAKARDGDESAGELFCWGPNPAGWEASIWLSPTNWGLGVIWDSTGATAYQPERRDYWTAQVGPLSFTLGKVHYRKPDPPKPGPGDRVVGYYGSRNSAGGAS